MSVLAAFLPLVPTASLAVTATAQTIAPTTIFPVTSGPQNLNVVRIHNSGTQVVFFLFGDPVNNPNANPAIPVVSATNGIPLLPNSNETFSCPPNTSVQVIAPATGSTVYVTGGEGR